MISTTDFSLISPDWFGVYTFALLQILDFMVEPTTAAFGEEGLNNVPLVQKCESTRKEFCRVTYARKELRSETRSVANFRSPSVPLVIFVIPQFSGQDVENFVCR